MRGALHEILPAHHRLVVLAYARSIHGDWCHALQAVEAVAEAGKCCILDIDVQGARQVIGDFSSSLSRCPLLSLLCPSMEVQSVHYLERSLMDLLGADCLLASARVWHPQSLACIAAGPEEQAEGHLCVCGSAQH